jgi:hypothetical protein
MRFVPAILVSLLCGLVLVAACLPWGVLLLDGGPEVRYYAWDASLRPAGIRVTNLLGIGAGLVAVLLVWLRACGLVRSPWVVAALLASLGACHAIGVYWFFDQGQALRLTNAPAVSTAGSGSLLAAVGWGGVALVCLGSMALPRRQPERR